MLHLHHHLAAIGQARAMDLSNRGGADGYRIELSEDLIRRPAQFGGDRGKSDFRLVRRHAVLQLGQFVRDFLPDEIGPGAEHLAELDVGGAQLGDCETDARGMRLLGRQLAFLAGEMILLAVEFGLTQPPCQPVLRQDADDLADPTDATEMLRR